MGKIKILLHIVLVCLIIGISYLTINCIKEPMAWKEQKTNTDAGIISRLKLIRSIQVQYRNVNGCYTGSFDTLKSYAKTGKIVYERQIGSSDDSIAVKKGLVKKERVEIAVKDSLLKNVNIDSLEFIKGVKGSVPLVMGANMIENESKIKIYMFEAKVPYKDYLDPEEQETINLIKEAISMDKYPGLKVGSLIESNNNAGNWE